MKLASLNNESPDGQLIVVSKDGSRFLRAPSPYPTLQSAIENWSDAEPLLKHTADQLEAAPQVGIPLNLTEVLAPLPRAWQWLDGSVYPSHAELMAKVVGVSVEDDGSPLIYQGLSDTFYTWNQDVPLPSEDLGIDFEGEFGVIVDEVPMGISAEEARAHIKLIVQINDWSLRALAAAEMKKGFGWLQAKPACSAAPFAVTPDALGAAWHASQVQLRLKVSWNGEQFGNAHGGQMAFGFDELIAHAAKTRTLVAGTIIGSGTVSNPDFRTVGSSCIAERRGIEIIDTGVTKTDFMRFGDRVHMEACSETGETPFGRIDQKVVAS